MSGVLKLAQKFNCFYLSGLKSCDYKPFVVEGFQVGLVRPDVMKQLLKYPEVFHVNSGCVELNPAFRDYKERSNEIDKVLRKLRAENVFIALKGWRDEFYEVKTQFNSQSLLKMDRSATCLFGIRNYGVDINGYIKHPVKGLCLWFQKRSPTKQTWPGKWDHMVGGGLSVGHGILETAHKEAMEEASVSPHLLKDLISAGCVSGGIFPNTEFVFDLELPVDFVPVNADGEVETFELLSAEQSIERILSPDFKTTSAPITLDFLIRHGVITPENEEHFLEIVELLHVPLQSIYERYAPLNSNNSVKENGIPPAVRNS
ncbi:hypothetical protein NQ317_016016 [Molorchus minor]|uniref:Nudix hydrolase domain-containing protein n=1 Tax=Molorchus minor TaxID=1323400 RepID=A0ABQ9JTQ6_9CUCU|nr:hypothetical protein NQ317_016016 [Molorchus minor]